MQFQSVRRSATSVVLFLLITHVASADSIVHVDDDAPPGGDGSSWTAALRHLQDALALADDPANLVCEIRVGGGVYRPDEGQLHPGGSGSTLATFQLIDGVAVRGGYLGLAAQEGQDPDERDISGYVTLLDGDLAANDTADLLSLIDNIRHVVTGNAVGPSAVLEGLAISGGNGAGSARGGGMRRRRVVVAKQRRRQRCRAGRRRLSRFRDDVVRRLHVREQ